MRSSGDSAFILLRRSMFYYGITGENLLPGTRSSRVLQTASRNSSEVSSQQNVITLDAKVLMIELYIYANLRYSPLTVTQYSLKLELY